MSTDYNSGFKPSITPHQPHIAGENPNTQKKRKLGTHREVSKGDEKTKEMGPAMLKSAAPAGAAAASKKSSIKKSESPFQGVKNFFTKLMGKPINGDIEQAKTIKANIKQLESDVQKYQKDVSSEKPLMSAKERNELVLDISRQARILHGQSIKARDLGKEYSSCKSYSTRIDNALAGARECSHLEQISSSIHAMLESSKLKEGSTPMERIGIMKNKLNEKEGAIFKHLEEMIKSNPDLEKRVQEELGEPLKRENVPTVLHMISPNLAKRLEKTREFSKEVCKVDQQKHLRSLTQERAKEITSLLPIVTEELKEKSDPDLRRLQFIFEEFVKTEQTFKANLEDLKTYKEALDHFVGNPHELQNMEINLPPEALKELRECINQNVELLAIIEPFANEISGLNVRGLPAFAEKYIGIDFTPILNGEANQKRFEALAKIHGSEIMKLGRALKGKKVESEEIKKIQEKFHPKLQSESIASSMIAVIQRPPRYVLLFTELMKHAPEGTSLKEMTHTCTEQARTVASGMNEYGRI